ncbi:hypothetical protein CASFOL_028160 [Castilleja foliolosa]|uniref:F-box domain-containing protein n=1 Tax=Castilleja foliolosa TaxID=1961234 RepID=A0ABD3CDV9_9LAMI
MQKGPTKMKIEDDTISRLPESILHHILSFLPQNDVARASVLSKSWHRLWTTRPKLVFRESRFSGNKKAFLSYLDKTLENHNLQKLAVHEFNVDMSEVDRESILLLNKLIPIVVLNMGVKIFNLSFSLETFTYLDLPLVVIQSESLQKFTLRSCKLNQVDNFVPFSRLQTLSFTRVHVEDETFEKIMSSCPSIEYLALNRCKGLTAINVYTTRNRNLKHFEFRRDELYPKDCKLCQIEIDVQTLETVIVESCPKWFIRHNHLLQPRLKSMYLKNVRLSVESVESFSFNFPCLEDLTLSRCYGIKELTLSSRSIKCLKIEARGSIAVVIDAPNICCFEYACIYLPSSMSFTTSPGHKWTSSMILHHFANNLGDNDDDRVTPSWLQNLNEVLAALSRSEITLHLSKCVGKWAFEESVLDMRSNYPRLTVVESLEFILNQCDSRLSLSSLVNGLFRICRPRYVGWCLLYGEPQNEWEREQMGLTEFLCTILVTERERRSYIWQQDLEEVVLEARDIDGGWHMACLSELLQSIRETPRNVPIRFQLKWKLTEIVCESSNI